MGVLRRGLEAAAGPMGALRWGWEVAALPVPLQSAAGGGAGAGRWYRGGEAASGTDPGLPVPAAPRARGLAGEQLPACLSPLRLAWLGICGGSPAPGLLAAGAGAQGAGPRHRGAPVSQGILSSGGAEWQSRSQARQGRGFLLPVPLA